MRIPALALLVPLTMITGCTNAIAGSPRPESTATGTFMPGTTDAITYDPAVVPPGATAKVVVVGGYGRTRVELDVAGMIPSRAYGAHLHTEPCTATPAEAGPHYQHTKDPAAAASPPSVDPAFANPDNEVWLDFTAGPTGAAQVRTSQTWTFPDGESARSLIIHAQQTATAPGKAGTAGPRVACLTLPAG